MRIVLFNCRNCDAEIPVSTLTPQEVSCPNCSAKTAFRPDHSLIDEGIVRLCPCCGHDALYVQKDFNRKLGLVIVSGGVGTALFFFSRTEPILAMLTLLAAAAVDLIIYALVREVTVCYSCHAIYRGFNRNPEHSAFDLKNLEKYGGRDPRF